MKTESASMVRIRESLIPSCMRRDTYKALALSLFTTPPQREQTHSTSIGL